jgi:hypothetical protein
MLNNDQTTNGIKSPAALTLTLTLTLTLAYNPLRFL